MPVIKEPLRLYFTKDQYAVKYPVGSDIENCIDYINKVTRVLKKIVDKHHFLKIWVTGSSGAILAALLARSIKSSVSNCIIYHVKKEQETSHNIVTNYKQNDNELNIIIDDFCRTGDSLYRIWQEARCFIKTFNILILGNFTDESNIKRIPFETLVSDNS